jgi:hypothetical protein
VGLRVGVCAIYLQEVQKGGVDHVGVGPGDVVRSTLDGEDGEVLDETGESAGRSDSQNWTGSGSLAGHSASSQALRELWPSVACRISRPAGRIRRATKREYIRMRPGRPERPVPGRGALPPLDGALSR